MLENSTYSVISPEGAASILWKDSGLAKRAAESMRITAPDLKELGVIDQIIPEIKGGAHKDMNEQAMRIEKVLIDSLKELTGLDKEQLVSHRYDKFKKIGEISSLKDFIGVK